MSLTLTYNGNVIEPVYQSIPWTVFDTSAASYFLVNVSINGDMITQKLYQDNSTANFDMTGLLRTYFTSDASLPADIYQYTVSVTNMYAFAGGVINAINTYTYPTNTYIFNGVNNEYSNFDLSTYVIANNLTGKKFLNNVSKDLYVHYNASDTSSLLTLETFTGAFGMSPEPSINKLTVTKYYASGSPDVSTITMGFTSTPAISKIDISPKTLNIPFNCTHYTVNVSSGRSETKNINIIKRSQIYDKYFRIMYIDSRGCTNYYNFSYNYSQTYDITRNEYNVNHTYKPYNTLYNNNYIMSSGWIKQIDSIFLKDLWISPNIYVCTPPIDYTYKQIIIDPKTIEIKRSFNGLINYQVQFKYAKELLVQNS